MAAICRLCFRSPARISRVTRVLSAKYATFSEEDLPGPYPVTAKERAAAAKKYGMRVEDYEPYPDDGLGWGDYPKVKPVHDDDKDPHVDWDFPEERRNFGDFVHIEQDMLARTRPNFYQTPVVPLKTQFYMLSGVLLTLGGLFWIGSKYKSFRTLSPKLYPYNNLWLEKGNEADKAPEPPVHYII